MERLLQEAGSLAIPVRPPAADPQQISGGPRTWKTALGSVLPQGAKKKIKSAIDPKLRELRRIEKLPRYQLATTDLFGPELKLVDSASFGPMYREIFDHQIYAFQSKRLAAPRILDCGANIGLSVIYFKQRYPHAQIVAFEPDPKVFEVLKHNVSAMGLASGVELVQKGLWDKETTLQFHSEGADGGHISDLDSSRSNCLEVQTTRLRSYLEEPIDFLKMDIEGAEVVVLEDCKDRLANVGALFVEYHSFSRSSQGLDQILKIMKDAGFRYLIQSNSPIPDRPFIDFDTQCVMDLQVNVFAYRV